MALARLALSAALAAIGVVAACGDDTTTAQGAGTSGVPTFPASPAAEGGVPAGMLGAGAPCSVVSTTSDECASGICAAPDGALTPAPPLGDDASVDAGGAGGEDGGEDGGEGEGGQGEAGAPPAGFCTIGCGPPGNPSLDCSGATFTGICSGTGVCQVRAL